MPELENCCWRTLEPQRPVGPSHMNEGKNIAAWIAFATIWGGTVSPLFNWLYCLAMNAVIEGDRFETEPLRLSALGAIGCVTVYTSSILWFKKRRRWMFLVFGAGCAMMLGLMP